MLAQALSLVATAAFASAASINRRVESITSFTTSPVEFTYPTARGFDASTAGTYPCGGVAVSSTRQDFPMSGGEITLSASTVVANLNILYVNETDPTLFHDFSTYTDSIVDMSAGSYCGPAPDFTSIGYAGGENVTLLIIFELYGDTSDTYYYQCADVVLVDNSAYTLPSDVTCSNTSATLDIAPLDDSLYLHGENFTDDALGEDGQTISVTNTAAASTVTVTATTTAGSSGLSRAASGGIGAVVGIIFLAALVFVATMSGYLHWGKQHRRQQLIDDTMNSMHSTIALKPIHHD